MSPTKRTSTTKRTSKVAPWREDRTERIWITTWMDSPGVRHLAIAGPAKCGDRYLCDVFTACTGYIKDALDNTGTDMAVTCLSCLSSSFKEVAEHMNLDAIEDLNEPELYEHMIDRDGMAPGFELGV